MQPLVLLVLQNVSHRLTNFMLQMNFWVCWTISIKKNDSYLQNTACACSSVYSSNVHFHCLSFILLAENDYFYLKYLIMNPTFSSDKVICVSVTDFNVELAQNPS